MDWLISLSIFALSTILHYKSWAVAFSFVLLPINYHVYLSKRRINMKKLNKKNKVDNQLFFYVSGGTNETCTNDSCGSSSSGGSSPAKAMGGNTTCHG